MQSSIVNVRTAVENVFLTSEIKNKVETLSQLANITLHSLTELRKQTSQSFSGLKYYFPSLNLNVL